MKLKQAIVALALIGALGLLAYQSHLAWAKDEDVLSAEGPVTVSGQNIRVGNLVLHLDEDSYLYINNNDAYDDDPTLDDLAAFVRRNPGVRGVAEYWMLDGTPVALEVDIDTSKEVVGVLSLDSDLKHLRVDELRLPVSDDDTYIYTADDSPDLEDFQVYLLQHENTVGSVTYVEDGGQVTTTEIDVDSDAEIAGPLVLDFPRSRATVGGVSMRMTPDDTSIYIDDADATVDDLVRLWAHRQDLKADATYIVQDGDTLVEELDIDTSRGVYGAISVDVAGSSVTIDGTTLPISDDTSVYINDEEVSLEDYAAVVARNPGIAGYGYYYDMDPFLTEYVDVYTEFQAEGQLQIDAAASKATIDGRTLPLSPDADYFVNRAEVSLDDFIAFLGRNPEADATLYWTQDVQTAVFEIDLNTYAYHSGLGAVSADGTQILLTPSYGDPITAQLTASTGYSIGRDGATLQDLKSFLAQYRGYSVRCSGYTDGGRFFAASVDVDTYTAMSGDVSVDANSSQITVGGTTVPVESGSEIYLNWNSTTLADLSSLQAQGVKLTGYGSYYRTVSGIKIDYIEVRADLSGTTSIPARSSLTRAVLRRHQPGTPQVQHVHGRLSRRAASTPRRGGKKPKTGRWAHRKKGRQQVDLPGTLISLDAGAATFTYQPRGLAKPVTLKIRPSTRMELNGARIPFSQFALMVPANAGLWLEAVYSSHSHVARRIWCEQRLQEGVGQVVSVSSTSRARTAAGGPREDLTLNVATQDRAGRVAARPMRIFGHALVLYRNHIIRPSKIRPGYSIRFDGFQSLGKYYLPRVLVLPPPKKKAPR